VSEVRAFAEAFFAHFGARAFPLDDNLVVDLPPDLAATFGKPRLYLVFADDAGDGVRRELSPVEDLVVYGSRTFDQMLALLAGRGEMTTVCLPTHLPVEDESPDNDPAFPPLANCQVVNSQAEPGQTPYYVVNYRAVYLSDEKREEFLTVVLDAGGRPRPDKVGEVTGFASLLGHDDNLENLADSNIRPDLAAPPLNPPRSDGGEASSPSLVPTGEGWGRGGHVARISKRTLTLPAFELLEEEAKKTLRHMLDCAGDVARRQADARAAELETAIGPRLQKDLLRLTTFYRRLADEVDSGDPAQDAAACADLERDLTRKIADELESHRLRATLSPLSCAVVLAPVAHYRLTLATRHTRHSLELDRDLHSGQIEGLVCHHCREPIGRLALCDRGHAVHAHCLNTCARCGRDVCRACGIQPCAACGSLVCIDCIAVCAACDRWQCAGHVADCPVCGQPVCQTCAASCVICGVRQCRTHLASCLTCGGLTCEEHRWPCAICGRESCEAHADICAICGEPYCAEHGFQCRSCQQAYCGQCGRGLHGECKTCRQAAAAPTVKASSLPPIPGMKAKRYRWRRAGNRKFSVYIGRRWFGRAIVVADKAGRVVYHCEVSSTERLSRLLFGH
jgi:hypothetical protein